MMSQAKDDKVNVKNLPSIPDGILALLPNSDRCNRFKETLEFAFESIELPDEPDHALFAKYLAIFDLWKNLEAYLGDSDPTNKKTLKEQLEAQLAQARILTRLADDAPYKVNISQLDQMKHLYPITFAYQGTCTK